jgi:outer membrane murein-binding lipoprotein Lpp
MPKYFTIGIAILSLVVFCGCGNEAGYDDFASVYNQFIDAMEEYTANLEKAENADAIADAIDTYAKKMDAWAPEMKKIRGEHPEWEDKTKMPEELKPLNAKAEKLAQSMAGTFVKSMQYMNDPKVRAASERLQQAMLKMQ